MRTIHCDPGISDEALKTVIYKVQNAREKNKNLIFNITFDEMCIKKKIDWDGKQLHGFIDMGVKVEKIADNDSLPFATQVLLFMFFKIPIAFYLIKSLNGIEKANLLNNILRVLYEKEINVISVTFDGAASNIAMSEILGAKLKQINVESIVPYFYHPINKDKRIYIFYDPCHVLKFVRNAISKENIVNKDGNIISWYYLKELVELQDVQKLHVANKIRRRHVNFYNEKMKVNLAAQTLSNSVADALNFVEYDLKISRFLGASATATFCKNFNDMFDILNSRNLFNKVENKRAITKDTLNIKDKATYFIDYIVSLKIRNIPVLQSSVKLSFIGFIINLQNVIALAEELFLMKI